MLRFSVSDICLSKYLPLTNPSIISCISIVKNNFSLTVFLSISCLSLIQTLQFCIHWKTLAPLISVYINVCLTLCKFLFIYRFKQMDDNVKQIFSSCKIRIWFRVKAWQNIIVYSLVCICADQYSELKYYVLSHSRMIVCQTSQGLAPLSRLAQGATAPLTDTSGIIDE